MSTQQAAPISRLSLLAFDQHPSFERALLGLDASPTLDEEETIRTLKSLIYTGFRLAMRTGAERDGSGILVDAHYGADVARAAFDDGPLLVLSVERGGQEEHGFEFREDIGPRIETFDPAFTKVQVRYHPEGESVLDMRQLAQLARLSEWLENRGRRFLCELCVPATPAQREGLCLEPDRYDAEVRVADMLRAMHGLQAAGVEPDVWMLEGLERFEDCERVARQARAGDRQHVACIVRDRNANWEVLERWFQAAGSTPGFIGFALGPTLWWNPLRDLLQRHLTASEAAQHICDNYQRAQILWSRAALRSDFQGADASA